MRMSTKGLSVLLAIFVSVLMVQPVPATPLEGTVVSVDHTVIVLSPSDGEEVTVSGLGPKAYWNISGIAYPVASDYLYLDVYEGKSHCIAVEVCYDEDTCIQLRDPDTLIPLWMKFQTRAATDLSAMGGEGPNSDCPGC